MPRNVICVPGEATRAPGIGNVYTVGARRGGRGGRQDEGRRDQADGEERASRGRDRETTANGRQRGPPGLATRASKPGEFPKDALMIVTSRSIVRTLTMRSRRRSRRNSAGERVFCSEVPVARHLHDPKHLVRALALSLLTALLVVAFATGVFGAGGSGRTGAVGTGAGSPSRHTPPLAAQPAARCAPERPRAGRTSCSC